jgi:hypothetical protein
MRHWYRPLAFYAAMEVGAGLLRIALHAAGFQRQVVMGLPYYTCNMPSEQQAAAGRPRQPTSSSSASSNMAAGASMPWQQQQQQPCQAGGGSHDVPLVFVHGIGMGLVPYISFLFNLAATGGSSIGLWVGGRCGSVAQLTNTFSLAHPSPPHPHRPATACAGAAAHLAALGAVGANC